MLDMPSRALSVLRMVITISFFIFSGDGAAVSWWPFGFRKCSGLRILQRFWLPGDWHRCKGGHACILEYICGHACM